MPRCRRFLWNLAVCFSLAASRGTPSAADAPPLVAPQGSGVLINATTRNSGPSKQPLALAMGGAVQLPIVVSNTAGDASKAVAKELKHFLDEITGGNFQIETGDGTHGIVVGTMSEFTLPELVDALQIAHHFDGKEAYAIRTQPARLLLIGATDKGASHAVYRLLGELGCRWFFPADAWQVIPRSADLQFAKDITDRPEFLLRSIWYAWGNFDDDGHPLSTPAARRSARPITPIGCGAIVRAKALPSMPGMPMRTLPASMPASLPNTPSTGARGGQTPGATIRVEQSGRAQADRRLGD